MPKVTIDGIEYVPRSEVQISDEHLSECLIKLTAIQNDPESKFCTYWAWYVLDVLSPELAKLSDKNPEAAYHLARCEPLASVEQLARDLTKGELK